MRDVTYSMSMSLDGYAVGPDGRFDWSVPAPDVFALATDEVRELGVHLLGRHLYETMLFWEPGESDDSWWGDAEHEFARVWRALPKVVFSRTLESVRGNTRLATGGLAEEVARLRAEPGEGKIGVGGPTLAAEAAALDLIDEYRIRVYPVLVGGGLPFFAREERRVNLQLVESRACSDGVLYSRHRVVR